MKPTFFDNYFDNYMLSDYILKSYRTNIEKFVASVRIFPKDYRKKENADKRFKVYFYNTRSGKQKPINYSSYKMNGQTIQVNKRTHSHQQKIEHIENVKKMVIRKLRNDPTVITSLLYGREQAMEKYPQIFGIDKVKEVEFTTVKKAFELAIELKKGKVSDRYINDLRSISGRFLKTIDENKDIKELTKRETLEFLDKVGGSNKTYNNNLGNLSTLLTALKKRDYIVDNFLLDVDKLKTKPKLHKAFTEKEVKDIFKYLKKENKTLYYYGLHIYQGLMRPVTVNRLKVSDVNIKERSFITKTKTFDFLKIITDTLYYELYKGVDLGSDKNAFVFGRSGIVEKWSANDQTRQNHYGDLFKPVKDKFGFSEDYTWYSFRHSAAVKIYKSKCEELERLGLINYRKEAVIYLQALLNHKTYDTTLKYLRNITTLSQEDWSGHLK